MQLSWNHSPLVDLVVGCLHFLSLQKLVFAGTYLFHALLHWHWALCCAQFPGVWEDLQNCLGSMDKVFWCVCTLLFLDLKKNSDLTLVTFALKLCQCAFSAISLVENWQSLQQMWPRQDYGHNFINYITTLIICINRMHNIKYTKRWDLLNSLAEEMTEQIH